MSYFSLSFSYLFVSQANSHIMSPSVKGSAFQKCFTVHILKESIFLSPCSNTWRNPFRLLFWEPGWKFDKSVYHYMWLYNSDMPWGSRLFHRHHYVAPRLNFDSPHCAISTAVRFHEVPKLAFVAATLTAGLNDIAWHLFSPIRPVCPPIHPR